MHIVLSSAPTYKNIYDGIFRYKNEKVEREAPIIRPQIYREAVAFIQQLKKMYINLFLFPSKKKQLQGSS